MLRALLVLPTLATLLLLIMLLLLLLFWLLALFTLAVNSASVARSKVKLSPSKDVRLEYGGKCVGCCCCWCWCCCWSCSWRLAWEWWRCCWWWWWDCCWCCCCPVTVVVVDPIVSMVKGREGSVISVPLGTSKSRGRHVIPNWSHEGTLSFRIGATRAPCHSQLD